MNNYLQHHGILGQKWGVRRYQNEDGTLTPAGKARYNEDGTIRDPKTMSTKELNAANKRLRAENEYLQNTGRSQVNKGVTQDTLVKAGASFVGGVAAASVGQMAFKNITGLSLTGKQFVLNALLVGAGASVVSVTNSFGGSNPPNYGGKKK